jgi:hypothetical protein
MKPEEIRHRKADYQGEQPNHETELEGAPIGLKGHAQIG